MTLSTKLKNLSNSVLKHAGLKVDTLTSDWLEKERLKKLEQSGYFDRPAFPLSPGMKNMDPSSIFECIDSHRERFADFWDASRNEVGFSADNDYFGSPDAEVLYALARKYEPSRIVEIGCGNSTKISRLAILDGMGKTRLITIDPSPRLSVVELSDVNIDLPVEELAEPTPFSELRENDILFIDSSHELKPGNDLVYLYLNVIPSLHPGVLVHIHDIFLPYDYPCDWVLARGMRYAEQYLVQTMLSEESRFEVVWPGYYLQKTHPGFHAHFPDPRSRTAQSLWLRKRA